MSASSHALVIMAPHTAPLDLAPVVAVLEAAGAVSGEPRALPVPRSLADRRRCWVLPVDTLVDAAALRRSLDALASALEVDLVLQDRTVRHADYRLAVFDMDSTLIECEVIDELAARHGVGDAVAAITERAMRGELDFNQSFRERLGMLRGLSASVIESIAANLPVTEGVAELLPTLRGLGIRTAILSGGFEPFAQALQARFGFDEVHANRLEIEAGALTGVVSGDIVNGERKAALLEELRLSSHLGREQVIAVGDGANDLPMIGRAGLGVAFRAKPVVRAQAPHQISHVGLDGLTCLLGANSELVAAD